MVNTNMRAANNLATVQGLVIPVGWDDMGNITAAAISTSLEEEYLIDADAWGRELLLFLRQKVQVRGFVVEDENGQKSITVQEYSILED
jgi:hypothetical protein